MKTSILHLMIFSNIIFYSCDFNDQNLEYEDNLVVFGSIVQIYQLVTLFQSLDQLLY